MSGYIKCLKNKRKNISFLAVDDGILEFWGKNVNSVFIQIYSMFIQFRFI